MAHSLSRLLHGLRLLCQRPLRFYLYLHVLSMPMPNPPASHGSIRSKITRDIPSGYFQQNTAHRPNIRRTQPPPLFTPNHLGRHVHWRARQRHHVARITGACGGFRLLDGSCPRHGLVAFGDDFGRAKVDQFELGACGQENVCLSAIISRCTALTALMALTSYTAKAETQEQEGEPTVRLDISVFNRLAV